MSDNPKDQSVPMMTIHIPPLPVSQDDTIIRLVLPHEVGDIWHRVADRLQSALEHGVDESTLHDWLVALVNMRAQLWLLVNTKEEKLIGTVLTQFLEYKQHKTLHIILFQADDFRQIGHHIVGLEEFAKKNGAIALEQWGRPGWSRHLPRHQPGWELAYHVMRRPLK